MKMSDSVSRAGFNVRHIRHGNAGKRRSGTVGDRRRLLQESARHIDPKWTSKQVRRNGNVVAADTHLNAIFGRGDSGNWTEITTEEGLEGIVSYGTQRAENVYRKMTEKAYETTTIVSHLPKSLLTEVPGFYDNGRSRWVCDREVVENYANLLVEFLAENVLPEGMANVHGYAINLDETVPHVHVYADPFAPDDKHPGFLKSEAQKTWGQVNKTQGVEGQKRLLGKTKMKRYQADFRAFMIDNGVEIEKDADPVRSRVTLSKAEYAKSQETQREADFQKSLNSSTRRRLNEREETLKKGEEKLKNDTEALNERESKSQANIDAQIAQINQKIKGQWDELKKAKEEFDAGKKSWIEAREIDFAADRKLWLETREEQFLKDKQNAIEEARTGAYDKAFTQALKDAEQHINEVVDSAINNSQFGLVATAEKMVRKDGTTVLQHIKRKMQSNLRTKTEMTRQRFMNEQLTYGNERERINEFVRNAKADTPSFGVQQQQQYPKY